MEVDSYYTASQAKIRALSELEITRHLSADAVSFGPEPPVYRHLADALADPQVTAEVYACARELEIKPVRSKSWLPSSYKQGWPLEPAIQ